MSKKVHRNKTGRILKKNNPKNVKRAADWTKRKGCSVVKYDPETDKNFHDIDMDEYDKWHRNRIKEYEESKDLIERMKKYLPKNELSYGHKDAIRDQRLKYPEFELFYGFHKIANLRYASKYGDDESELSVQYRELRKRAEEFLNEKDEEERAGRSGILDIIDGIDFSDVLIP